jgi:D-glycero-alpha-D-manno-heptose-7-phosphate kinase
MIIARSPLRISLGGGGTDLPSYYQQHGGFCISAAIDRYVYISIHRRFVSGYLLKYSQLEEATAVSEIRHPILRECLTYIEGLPDNLEIASMADIPAGTGLGSSGSFTTALLKGLCALQRTSINPKELAEAACTIELDRLREPIGKQDQYIAAYGGLTCFSFSKEGIVRVEKLQVFEETLADLEDHLLLFFTGYSRSASSILKEQDDRSKSNDSNMVSNLHYVKELGYRSKETLEAGDTLKFASIMHEHWLHKKERSGGMSNAQIDDWYQTALRNGAVGGKLIGAGGGGFLMFYSTDNARLRGAMVQQGLREVRFRFDFEGSKLLSND